MKLEQQMYKISRVGKERIYTIGNLENLSATALYYGEGGGSSGFSGGIGGGGFGGIGKKECNKYGIVITPLMEDSEPLNLIGTGSSFKIFTPKLSYPLVRFDLDNHEFGEKHLQYGKEDYFGRSGNEAADIFAELLRLNPKIKFPGMDEE